MGQDKVDDQSPLSPEDYSSARELFHELIDLSERDRDELLSKRQIKPEIGDLVRDLLGEHEGAVSLSDDQLQGAVHGLLAGAEIEEAKSPSSELVRRLEVRMERASRYHDPVEIARNSGSEIRRVGISILGPAEPLWF